MSIDGRATAKQGRDEPSKGKAKQRDDLQRRGTEQIGEAKAKVRYDTTSNRKDHTKGETE